MAAGTPAVVVSKASEGLLGGLVGGTLVFLGVVILPISTGDTAFRTGRLILADVLRFEQDSLGRRIVLAVPLFLLGIYFAVGDFTAIWMPSAGRTRPWPACPSGRRRSAAPPQTPALGGHRARVVHDRRVRQLSLLL